MSRWAIGLVWAGVLGFMFGAGTAEAAGMAIFCPKNASKVEILAAREVCRYVYLRTGEVLPIRPVDTIPGDVTGGFVVGRKDRPLIEPFRTGSSILLLRPEEYVLVTVRLGQARLLVVTGGDDAGTLYGAYRLAEHLGVGFYLHGDAIPDQRMKLEIPSISEQRRPLFEVRGIQPFHDFPEGPDWWNVDDYKAYLSQLPKLGMNFFGLHTYPEGGVGPEPGVWIGASGQFDGKGRVRSSYSSTWSNTLRGTWGYQPKKTGDYIFGGSELFEQDGFGSDVMTGYCPRPATPEACNEVFNNAADLLRDAFVHAHGLGIRTCIGTETPQTVPKAVAAMGKLSTQAYYEGMFERIARAYPIDYYWFWTPEDWTWSGVSDQNVQRTVDDLEAAIAAAKKVRAPFTLATCGWVLGPPKDRAMFDKLLPKEMPMSCINRQVGKEAVEKGFANVSGRGKWAIPWMEDDPNLTQPQLWAGRMRKDAADALKYGCTGLLGIHWRTRILSPNVAALAQAAWDQRGWSATSNLKDRYLPTEDFYRDWATRQFGAEAAGKIGAIFAKVDGYLPEPSTWTDGPGGLAANPAPWQNAGKLYAFVDEMAAIRPEIKGAGNLERFDYWLNNFRYMKATERVKFLWAQFNEAMKKVGAEKDAVARVRLAETAALPIRKELVAAVGEAYGLLLATVSTPGELGTVCNWEQHIIPHVLTKGGEELAKALGRPLPADAQPARVYAGPARVIVPTVRTSVAAGEALKLKVIILSAKAPKKAMLNWRVMGKGEFAQVPLTHVARGVYRVEVPAQGADVVAVEYFVRVEMEDGQAVEFPASAPETGQTVVVER